MWMSADKCCHVQHKEIIFLFLKYISIIEKYNQSIESNGNILKLNLTRLRLACNEILDLFSIEKVSIS